MLKEKYHDGITIDELSDIHPSLYTLVDTRDITSHEYGAIPNSICTQDILEQAINHTLNKDKSYVLYCMNGRKSISLVYELQQLGYDAIDLINGYAGYLEKSMLVFDDSIQYKAERSIIKTYHKELLSPFLRALDKYQLIEEGDKIAVCISGGKDSSVVAALCVEALGKDRVIGVLMPQGEQSDIEYSKMLVDFLDITRITCNIEGAFNEVLESFEGVVSPTPQTTTNLPARIRMATLYAISQSVNGRVANTCNLSETLLSWETRWGDAVGDFAPISDLTVEEVKAIGYELGLPKELIEKIPSDGLCGSTDEDALGFKYSVMDRYIRTGEIDNKDIKKKIDNRVEKYRFKRMPIPFYKTGMKRYVD